MASKRTEARKRAMQEQAKLDGASICGANKRNGAACERPAGWGTDHPGSGRCKHHTGATRSGQISAAVEEMSGMARPQAITPGQALQGVMQLAAGQLLFATNKVAQLRDDELFVRGDMKDSGTWEMIPHKWLALQQQCMDKLAKYAKLAADAGIAERQTQLAEAQTQMITGLIERVMGDLGLTEEQQAALGPAIRRNLQLVASNGEPVAA